MTTATRTRAQEFRDQLSRRVIVADGAMGTMLYSRGVFINRCFDELNLSQPDMVRFGNLDELREAVMAARDAAGSEIPIIAQVTIDDYGYLPGGTNTEAFTKVMDAWPVDVIGLNCSVGPKATLETIERMMQHSTKPISAMPNAGLPMRVEGRNIYLCSPEYMSQYARRLLWAGVKVVGGCCGTTPDHIRLIRSETRSLQPLQKKLAITVEEPHVKPHALAPVPMSQKSKVGAKLAER